MEECGEKCDVLRFAGSFSHENFRGTPGGTNALTFSTCDTSRLELIPMSSRLGNRTEGSDKSLDGRKIGSIVNRLQINHGMFEIVGCNDTLIE